MKKGPPLGSFFVSYEGLRRRIVISRTLPSRVFALTPMPRRARPRQSLVIGSDYMTHFLKPLTLAALLATTSAAFAQEAADPATETPQTEAPAEAPAQEEGTAPAADPNAFDMGTPIGQPEEGQLANGAPYLRETYGDWEMRCINIEDGADPCTLYQLLEDQDGNAVAEIGLVPLEPGGQAVAGATIVAPQETLLTERLVMAIDGGQARAFEFTFCTQRPMSPLLSSGCVARIGFTEADVNAFRRGAEAKLSIVPAFAPDQKVELTVSLSGFTAGFEATNNPPE